jgi:mannose-6-phosphate isomerase
MSLSHLSPELIKTTVFAILLADLSAAQLRVVAIDDNRPWGGFLVIDPMQTDQFIDLYFSGSEQLTALANGTLSPKLLVVAPGKRLSWQYHHRRAELWRVLQGPVGVMLSDDDLEQSIQEVANNETVECAAGVRHRLIGFDNWGVVAEIWQHTDPENLSDEADIVRVADDFDR